MWIEDESNNKVSLGTSTFDAQGQASVSVSTQHSALTNGLDEDDPWFINFEIQCPKDPPPAWPPGTKKRLTPGLKAKIKAKKS